MHWPIQVAGLTTMAVAIAAKSNSQTGMTTKQTEDTATISSVGTVVGLGWVSATGGVKPAPPLSQRLERRQQIPGPRRALGQLMRERLAEEDLEKAAEDMRIIDDVAVVTNVSMNLALAWHANETGYVMAAVGVATSFIPWIFPDRQH